MVTEPRSGAPKKRKKGSQMVYEKIRNEILELKLSPGTALDETSLATQFDMSRSPIREALVRLSGEGLVKTLSNRSTIVSPLDVTTLPRFVEAIDYIQRVVTRLAARNRLDSEIEPLMEAAQAYDDLCSQGHGLSLSRANRNFHMLIAEAGRNPYLTDAYGRLLDEGRRILHLHYAHAHVEGEAYLRDPDHFRIIDAIKAQDERLADALSHEHTRVLHKQIQDLMAVTFIKDIEA
jgi:DNA-binding GntR family transcriptional regulator